MVIPIPSPMTESIFVARPSRNQFKDSSDIPSIATLYIMTRNGECCSACTVKAQPGSLALIFSKQFHSVHTRNEKSIYPSATGLFI